ncbi:MAG: hypothetical protein RJA34_159 [Pseudomonadota bacterium]|jgi:NAD+ synthase (glutamine-hydrolysing)
MTLKMCVAQLNFVVGDLKGNAQKIIDAASAAHAAGHKLLLTPELSICGYAAEDLFLRPSFIEACDHAVQALALALKDLAGLTVVVGHPSGGDVRSRSVSQPLRFNAASVLRDGKVQHTYAKQQLPNYQVFDERRYFVPGHESCVFEVNGDDGQTVRIGLLICEDAWFEAPAQRARQQGAEVLAVINASPFHVGKWQEREQMMQLRAKQCGLPVVYAHMVGGQDEIIFEGRSFAVSPDGSVVGRAPAFEEALLSLNLSRRQNAGMSGAEQPCVIRGAVTAMASEEEDLWCALVLGVRDYVHKNGFPSVLLGLSGGIDSAVVMAIAVDALGADRVRAVMMPSPYTADISWIDARDMAQRMRVRYDEISIVPAFSAFKTLLAADFEGLAEDATEENIQARIRGTLLMALSNKFGSLVLTTGNKSEMSTGYCTLYGDMAGGFAAIKDVVKTKVFQLARWRNLNDPYGTGVCPIPERIITRPPSAELRPDQKDQDSLPPYEVLDEIVQRYVENDEGIESMVATGLARADVERVTRLIKINEYKRRQAPVGVRVTHRSFGKDWRYPITNKFRA